MVIVAFSYMRPIKLYPNSGGSHTVARRTWATAQGWSPGVGADHRLHPQSCCASAGIEALMSYLNPQGEKVLMAVLVSVHHAHQPARRGASRAGGSPCWPTAFITMIGLMIGSTLMHYFQHSIVPVAPHTPLEQAATGLLWFVLAKAFSNGCSALTGVEAV